MTLNSLLIILNNSKFTKNDDISNNEITVYSFGFSRFDINSDNSISFSAYIENTYIGGYYSSIEEINNLTIYSNRNDKYLNVDINKSFFRIK